MAFTICKSIVANPLTFFILLISTLLVTDSTAQQSEVRMSDDELHKFLDSADEQATVYTNVFKNLYADQTKTTEVFDRSGKLEKRRIVLSDLIIYEAQSGTSKGDLREYHNVREVDGKRVKNRDRRAINLFSRLKSADSIEEELEKIKKESLRYDREISVYGLVLAQSIALSRQVRQSFKFAELRTEKVGEEVAVVIGFQQTSEHSSIDMKIKSPDQLETSNPYFRGELWIDLKTKSIRRFWQEVTLESPRFNEPFVVIRQEAEYRPSEFGIPLPTRITYDAYNLNLTKKDFIAMRTEKIKPVVYLNRRLLIEYKMFRKFDVSVAADR